MHRNSILALATIIVALAAANPLAAQVAADLDCNSCVQTGDIRDNGIRSRDLAPTLRKYLYHQPGYEVTSEQILDGTITGAELAPDLLEGLRNPQAEVIQVDCAAGESVQDMLDAIPRDNTQHYRIELLSDCAESFYTQRQNNIMIDGQGFTVRGEVTVSAGTNVHITSMTLEPNEEGSCAITVLFTVGMVVSNVSVEDCPANGIILDGAEATIVLTAVVGSGESGLYARRGSKITMELVWSYYNGYTGIHLRDGSNLYAFDVELWGNGSARPPTELLPEPAGILLQGSHAALGSVLMVDNIGAQARLETGSTVTSNVEWNHNVVMTYGYTTARQYPWAEDQYGRQAFALSGGSEIALHGGFVSGDIHVTEDSSYSQTSKRWDSYLPHVHRYEGDIFADHRSYVGFDDFLDFNAVLTCDGATQAYCKHPPLPVPELTASN